MKIFILASVISLALITPVEAEPLLKPSLVMNLIGQYQTGIFDEGAAEIVVHDEINHNLFVINASAAKVDVLDINNPKKPLKIAEIDVSTLGAGVNSVAIHQGLVAVAIESNPKQDPGKVAFFDVTDFSYISDVEVGALPDMVTFTPDGRYVLVANEGEPNDAYTVDPEGSISIIDVHCGLKQTCVRTADFKKYIGREHLLRAMGIRIFGPNANTAQDLEPEYITVSANSHLAWVSLQEANALAVVDIRNARIKALLPLGSKDHSLPGNGLDASNKDKGINIMPWPIQGMYMPDTIGSYSFRGKTYIATANEGDSRNYAGYNEEVRVKNLKLDPHVFPNATVLQKNKNLGRLYSTRANGDTDGDGDVDVIYSFGARSFSIWSCTGHLVYDSGSDFEHITAAELGRHFKSNIDKKNSLDNRSDDKGPEPEGIALGKIAGRTIAFIGLERVGGIMAYDITNPFKVEFLKYINNRNFSVSETIDNPATSNKDDVLTKPLVDDIGPEGLLFISAKKSPTGIPMLVVGNEVSGTTTLYDIKLEKSAIGNKH